MNESSEQPTERGGLSGFVAEHRFIVLVLASIVISIALVMVSLSLYVSSGTAQLDLSRPGYKAIRDQVQQHDASDSFNGFDASGDLDKAALQEFDKLYSQKLKEATSTDAFGNDVLSPESLQIDQQSAAK